MIVIIFFSKHVVSFCGLRPQTSTGAPPLGPSGNVGPQTILGPDFQNILRQSYVNAKVTIDLRRTSNLQKHPTKGARFFLGTIHLQTCKIV